jgi:hypothetical protein
VNCGSNRVDVRELDELVRRFDADDLIDLEYLQDLYDGFDDEDDDDSEWHHRNTSQRRTLTNDRDTTTEIKMLQALKPLLPDHPRIMYWRPQKVGSSTILSLLISFAYRYNLMNQRKGSPSYMCKKMAKCALEHWAATASSSSGNGKSISSKYVTISGSDEAEYVKQLEFYIENGKWIWPKKKDSTSIEHELHGKMKFIGRKNKHKAARESTMDHLAESFDSIYMSTNHELCYLDKQLIQDYIGCSFQPIHLDLSTAKRISDKESEGILDNIQDKLANAFHTKQEPVLSLNHMVTAMGSAVEDGTVEQLLQAPITGLKEIFVVREPLDRAVSVYYFWGELHMITLDRKQEKSATRLERMTHNRHKMNRSRKMELREAGIARAEAEASGNTKHEGKGYELDQTRLRSRKLAGSKLGVNSSSRQLKTARLGQAVRVTNETVYQTPLFDYHGNESTPPPLKIAMDYSRNLFYMPGFPGPSATWSAFAQSSSEAVDILRNTDRLMTIVTERLDESLICMKYYMGWSLADVIAIKTRKSLSPHPKVSDWPDESVKIMRERLIENGEYRVYDAAVKKLDDRLQSLRDGTWQQNKQGTAPSNGSKMIHKESRSKDKHRSNNGNIENDIKDLKVDVESEIYLLVALRNRVTKFCESETYLNQYRKVLSGDDNPSIGLPIHHTNNKLRDSEDFYADNKHQRSFNKDIIFSYDICGNCEAHALLLGYHDKYGYGNYKARNQEEMQRRVDELPPLKELNPVKIINNVNFMKCSIPKGSNTRRNLQEGDSTHEYSVLDTSDGKADILRKSRKDHNHVDKNGNRKVKQYQEENSSSSKTGRNRRGKRKSRGQSTDGEVADTPEGEGESLEGRGPRKERSGKGLKKGKQGKRGKRKSKPHGVD